MNIGQAAKAPGASAKMIRCYESIGLVPRAGRTEAGYRVYTDADMNTLRFIHRAREFGFPIERIRLLVSLWRGRRPSSEVKGIATEHGRELRRRIEELTAMADALQELADQCEGDHRPDCPILHDLEGRASTSAEPARHGSEAGSEGWVDVLPRAPSRCPPARALAQRPLLTCRCSSRQSSRARCPRRVSDRLRLLGMRRGAAAKARRLLRVLLLRFGALPAASGRSPHQAGLKDKGV
jgi:MerR family transcriptional regulator, copper efflux regulator